jgi:hypothetical protein
MQHHEAILYVAGQLCGMLWRYPCMVLACRGRGAQGQGWHHAISSPLTILRISEIIFRFYESMLTEAGLRLIVTKPLQFMLLTIGCGVQGFKSLTLIPKNFYKFFRLTFQ